MIYDVLTTLRRTFIASYLESAAPEDGIAGWFFHKDYTKEFIIGFILPMAMFLFINLTLSPLTVGRASSPFAITEITRILLIIHNFLVDCKWPATWWRVVRVRITPSKCTGTRWVIQ